MNQIYANKRRSPDLILRLLAWMNAIAVASLVITLFLVAFAKPDLETFFDRYYNITLRTTWDKSFFVYIGFFLFLSLLTSLLGLYFNSKRLKRKGDYIHSTLVISLVVSCIALFFFFRLIM